MRRRPASCLGIALALLTACRGGDGSSDAPVPADAAIASMDAGAGSDPDAATDGGADLDPTAQLFRADHIVEVNITLAPEDWEQLRNEPRKLGLTDVTCADQPEVEGYTEFTAEITVDGTTLSNVAVRKKGGLGSISSTRPGLKVDVHEYVAKQRIYGLKHLTLNNNVQDPTLISQCLGYGLFRAAGIPASRCNFAHVVVNGEDLGVYSNVETLKKDFLARNFEDDSGNLYESGGDFVPGGVGNFQPKSDLNPPDCRELDPVVAALAAPDAELADRLGAVVDLDEFMRFWAMEVITNHWDGYTNNQNNFYFYADPSTEKLTFLPWGIDSLFTVRERTTRPDSVFACGALAFRLYDAPTTRALYLATLRDLLDTVWKVPAILAEVDRMERLLTPLADPDGTGSFATELAAVRSFVSGRAAVLRAELDASDPVWPYPADESCRINLGTVSATFETTWDTLDMFGVGSGTMEGTIAGVSLMSTTVSAAAGVGTDGKPALQLFNELPDGRYAVVFVILQDALEYTPGTFAIDLVRVASLMTFYDPVTDTSSGGGLLLPGTLTITSAGSDAGDTIAGSLTGQVIEL